MGVSICSVVAFVDHTALTVAATVYASLAILSAMPFRRAMSSLGSTLTRDDPQSAKPTGYAVFMRARRLGLQDSFRSCPS
jgi:hypothetical protein